MNNIKKYITYIKNSAIAKYFVDKLSPTFYSLKINSGYKIILMALILDIILIPFNVGLKILTTLFSGFFSVFDSISESPLEIIESLYYGLKYSYMSTSETVQIVGFLVASIIISVASFILLTFYLPNGAFNSFKVYLEENRVVTLKEFFKLTKFNIKKYIRTFIKVIFIPLLLIHIVAVILNFVPFIAGYNLSVFARSIIKYALLFKMYAILLELDGEEEMIKNSKSWFTYAIFVYLITRITLSSLIIKILNTIFILYVLLTIYSNKYEEINSINKVNINTDDSNIEANYNNDNNSNKNIESSINFSKEDVYQNIDNSIDRNISNQSILTNNKIDTNTNSTGISLNSNTISNYNNVKENNKINFEDDFTFRFDDF